VGHLEGDRMLRVIAEILRAATRSSDLTARYGGEEFAVLMPNADEHSAQITAERIRLQIETSTREILPMTVSIGVATFATDVADAFDLVRRADDALYLAKRSGKNRVSTRVA
jgi:diguanylate cyclase (GGDEF)-like protein